MRISGTNELGEGEDRISSLSDDVINRILSFLEVKDVVRTSVLSTRWKHVWSSLPFLTFDSPVLSKRVFAKTVNHILASRNHQSQVLTLKLNSDDVFPVRALDRIVTYAIAHGCEDLYLRSSDCKLSLFNSKSLTKLSLTMNFDKLYLQCLNHWNLPALHTLQLENYLPSNCYRRLPFTSLSCLCCLTSLSVVRVSLPVTFDLPLLRSLVLVDCELPENIWKLPCLINLVLIDLHFSATLSEFLSSLVRLENLRLISSYPVLKDCLISCPRLINLELKTKVMAASKFTPHILLLAPHISNINISGLFLMSCGVLELETVNVNLQGCVLDKTHIPGEMLQQFYCRLFPMFLGLGGAKILGFDMDTFEALSTVSNYLELLPSPFHNLNSVKLPQGCKESNMSPALRKYLLGGAPGATIVTAIPRNIENHQAGPASQTSQKVMVDELLATPIKEMINFQDLHKQRYADTMGKRVQVQQLVENSEIDAARVRQAGASVAGSSIDQNIENLQAVPGSQTSQKVVLDEPSATPTKKLIGIQIVHKKGCADTVKKRLQGKHLVGNSVVDATRVRQASAAVAGSSIDQASSSGRISDCRVWKGHQAVPVSLTSQKVMVDESLAILTKELVESQDL